MATWHEITRDPEYQELSEQGKALVKQGFFEREISSDPEFKAFSPQTQKAVFDDFWQTPDDTGQGIVTSTLGSAIRGAGEIVPGTLQGVGALTGITPISDLGESARAGLEYVAPVNPIYEQGIPAKVANVAGNVASIIGTSGVGGLAGKVLGAERAAAAGSAAARQALTNQAIQAGAKSALYGTGFAQGAAAKAEENKRLGITGAEGYLNLLGGGVSELAPEMLPFGTALESAAARRLLGGVDDAAGRVIPGIRMSAAQEAAEGGSTQVLSNLSTQLTAPTGVEAPDLFEGAGEAALWEGVGGAMFGAINKLGRTPPEKQTDEQKAYAAELGAVPVDSTPPITPEESLENFNQGGIPVVSPDGVVTTLPFNREDIRATDLPFNREDIRASELPFTREDIRPTQLPFNREDIRSTELPFSRQNIRGLSQLGQPAISPGLTAAVNTADSIVTTAENTSSDVSQATTAARNIIQGVVDTPQPREAPTELPAVTPSPAMEQPEKPSQILTGSNVQTSTEMPVSGESTAISPSEAPISEQPSPNLAPRANITVARRPARKGRDTSERDAWDEKYGGTHNEDGTPYQPTILDEVFAKVRAALAATSFDENIDSIGVDNGVEARTALEQLLNDGWVWDETANKMVNTANPSETPALGLRRIRSKKKSTPQPQPIETATDAIIQREIPENRVEERLQTDEGGPSAAPSSGNRFIEGGQIQEEVAPPITPQGTPTPATEGTVMPGGSAIERDATKGITFRYEMRARPPSIGTHPENGFVSHEEGGTRHGFLTYDRPLTEQEIYDYELKPVATDSTKPTSVSSAKPTESGGKAESIGSEQNQRDKGLTSSDKPDNSADRPVAPKKGDLVTVSLGGREYPKTRIINVTNTPEGVRYQVDVFGPKFVPESSIVAIEQPVIKTAPKVAATPQLIRQLGDIAVKNKQPLDQGYIDSVGGNIPQGYVKQGDLYVFSPQTTTVAKPTEATKDKANTVKSTELRVGDEVSFKGNTYRVKNILSDGRVRAEFTNPEGIAKLPAGSVNITTLPRNVNFTRIDKQSPQTKAPETETAAPSAKEAAVASVVQQPVEGSIPTVEQESAITAIESNEKADIADAAMAFLEEDLTESKRQWSPEKIAAAKAYFASGGKDMDVLRAAFPKLVGSRPIVQAYLKADKEASEAQAKRDAADAKLAKEIERDEKEQAKAEAAQKKRDELNLKTLNSLIEKTRTNVVQGTVKSSDANQAVAILNKSGAIPNVLFTWIGTSKDFLADPANRARYPETWKAVSSNPNIEGMSENGQPIVFTDNVGVSDLDRNLAKLQGTTPEVAAVRRVILHENIHKGMFFLSLKDKMKLFQFLHRLYSPEELDQLAKSYDEYSDWRINQVSYFSIIEEAMTRDFDSMAEIPRDGIWAEFMQFLRDIWQKITGKTSEPTLKNYKDVFRLIRNSLKNSEKANADRLKNGGAVRMSKGLSALFPRQATIQDAYRAASQGQSSQYILLADVFAKAKEANPSLTEEAFKADVMRLYDSGAIYLEGANSQQEAEAASLSIPGTSVGTAVRIAIPQPMASKVFNAGLSSIPYEPQSGTTQVATTVGSYQKAANMLLSYKSPNIRVLDYGAGLGLGSDAMREEIANVDSFEVNPERWKGSQPPTFTDSSQIAEKYDGIVNLNVLNVVPKNIRDAIVDHIGSLLNDGGRAIIGVRKWSGDVDRASGEAGAEPKSIVIKKKQGDTFQKGFDGNELVDYLKERLGDGFLVVKANIAANGAIVTKLPSQAKASKVEYDSPNEATFNSGAEVARNADYDERDKAVRSTIRAAYDLAPKPNGPSVPLDQLFDIAKQSMPDLTEGEFSQILQDLYEDSGALLQAGESPFIVTTSDGQRAGSAIIVSSLPTGAMASTIDPENDATKKFVKDIQGIESGTLKAAFGGRQFFDFEPVEYTVRSNKSYEQTAINYVNNFIAEGGTLEQMANSVIAPNFLAGIGIEDDVMARQALVAEVKNRVVNVGSKKKSKVEKKFFERLNQRISAFWQGVGSKGGRNQGQRAYIIGNPRYSWMFLTDEVDKELKQRRDNILNVQFGNDNATSFTQNSYENADMASTVSADEVAKDTINDTEWDLIKEGEQVFEGARKTIWESVKFLVARIALYARRKSMKAANAKASFTDAQRNELNAILQMSDEEADAAEAKDLAELDSLMAKLLGEESPTDTPTEKKKRNKRKEIIDTVEKRVKAGEPIEAPEEVGTSEDEVTKAEATAQAILKDLSERYSDPLIFRDKKPNINEMRELYKERVKQGNGTSQMTEKTFVNKAIELGADEKTAGILWSAAELEIDAREAMRQDKIRQRNAAAGERADAQAHRIIFAKERLKRQSGFADIDTNPNKDTIIKAFREQVKTPIALDAFIQRLIPLKVSRQVAERLFRAAERENTDLAAMAVYDRTQGPKALKRMISEINLMRRGEEIPLRTPIPWRKLLSQKAKTVEEYRQRIFDAISANEELKSATPEQKARLADLFTEAWESNRKRILDGMQERLIREKEAKGELSKKGAEALQEQRMRMVEDINLGIFDNDEIAKIMAEKFGIKSEFTDAEREKIESLIEVLQDEKLNRVKRNKAAYELLETLSAQTDIPISKLLANFWVSSVLSGMNTVFSIGMSVFSGMGELTTTLYRIFVSAFSNPKQLPSEVAAAFKTLARVLSAVPRQANRAWQYLVTGDQAFLDPTMNDALKNMDWDSIGKNTQLAEQMAKSDKTLQKVMGLFMRTVSRLLTALDLFNSGLTKEGSLSLVFRQLNLDPAKIEMLEKKSDLKAYKAQVIEKYFGNMAPKTAREKALVDSYAMAEMMKELDELGSVSENADQMAMQGAMTLDPSGIGGYGYRLVKSMMKSAESGADKLVERNLRKWDEAQDASDKTEAFVKLALSYIFQFAAYNAANLVGVRFARFAGNKFNQSLSFLPIIGALRLYEAEFDADRIRGKEAFTDMIKRNQLTGVMAAAIGYVFLKAIAEEPDDEKRGWFINGGWSNLTPEKKQQKLASGQKEYTLGFGDTVINYGNWPGSGIIAAIGGLSDLIRFSPEQWSEKTVSNKLMSATASGVFSALEVPALSQFQELFGSSLSSKDPNEQKLTKFARVIGNYAGGFVPRILKDIDYLADPNFRKYETLWEKTASHIPIYRRYEGKEYYDILGQQIQRNIYPGSREFMTKPTDPAYKVLGALNSRGIWLTPANAEHRMVGKGARRRSLTQEEADNYSLETGKGYKQMLLRYGQRALQMPTERAKAFLLDKADDVRDRALKKVYRGYTPAS